jgi:hypothetical protein
VAAQAAAKVQEAMGGLAKKVPMHTWLAALPQLISRMCHPCKEVSETAKQIIVNITQVGRTCSRCSRCSHVGGPDVRRRQRTAWMRALLPAPRRAAPPRPACPSCPAACAFKSLPLYGRPQSFPHQSLWSLAAVSKSGVPARRAAAGAITNAAKKSADHALFGGWAPARWRAACGTGWACLGPCSAAEGC